MRRLAVALALLLLPAAAGAGDPIFVVAASYTPTLPPVRIQVRADYVAIPLTIATDSKDVARGSEEIERALRAVTEQVKKQPGLQVRTGVVSLAPREAAGYLGSSSGSYGGSSARLHVVTSLKDDNVFAATRRIHQALAGLKLDGSRLTFGNAVLGVDDPEKHRAPLLGLVARAVADTKRALGAGGRVQLGGLEAPVGVMQVNDSDVALWLGYRLQVELSAQ
jgi:hypothetical protein